jgi:hypothetical protein
MSVWSLAKDGFGAGKEGLSVRAVATFWAKAMTGSGPHPAQTFDPSRGRTVALSPSYGEPSFASSAESPSGEPIS